MNRPGLLRIVGGMVRGRLDVAAVFADFLYLFTESETPASPIEVVPGGVAAEVAGMLAIPVATDAGPVRVSLELHDAEPPGLETVDKEDVAVLTWRPLGRQGIRKAVE